MHGGTARVDRGLAGDSPGGHSHGWQGQHTRRNGGQLVLLAPSIRAQRQMGSSHNSRSRRRRYAATNIFAMVTWLSRSSLEAAVEGTQQQASLQL
jgi:hypothetical protein